MGELSAQAAERPVAFEVSSLLVKRQSGIAVYGEGLVRAVACGRPDRGHCQLYRLSRFPRRALRPVPELPARAYITGARLHLGFGLLHALDTRIPAAFRGPLIATLFDVISALPLAGERRLSSPRFRARKLRDYQTIARRADLVIALSEETRRRFLGLVRPRGPAVVVPPGVAAEFLAAGESPPEPRPLERWGIGGRYVLAVGGFWPRKNLEAAVGAIRRARKQAPELTLAVAGEPVPGWEESPPGRELAADPRGVRLLGYLGRRDLARAYAGASALLYLSHYEGFGLPVLEAMAAGAPVIASRRGGIPEAAGDAALLVDPDDPREVDCALERVLCDQALAARLVASGRSRARGFRWERAALLVEEAYAEARAVWKAPSTGRRGYIPV